MLRPGETYATVSMAADGHSDGRGGGWFSSGQGKLPVNVSFWGNVRQCRTAVQLAAIKCF